MPEQSIEQELQQAQILLKNWSLFKPQIERVRQLEMGTMYTPKEDRAEGYYRLPALQGYAQIINAYAIIGNISAEQREALGKVSMVLQNLQDDQGVLGEKPDPYQIPRYAAQKLHELETTGSIYMVSGHVEHFNITKITRQKDGSYNYTLYDAGHESKVIDWKGDRPVIQAVQEFKIQPGTDILKLIETDVAKKGSWSNSPEYAAAKGFIDGALVYPPIRAEQEYGQRKGNCTTRGQRLMAADMLQDQALSEALYDFASNVGGTSTDDIKQALQARVMHLENLQACGAGNHCRSLNVDNFLKATDTETYEHAQIGLDGGGRMEAYRTKPGAFDEATLKTLQETLERNGMKSMVRESITQPGKFYLYVTPENAEKINETLAKEQSLAGDAYRKAGDNAKAYLEVRDFVKMADPANYEHAAVGRQGGGHQAAYRTKPGVFAKQELEQLKATLLRNGMAAEIKDSVSSPGKSYLYVPDDKSAALQKALQNDGSYAGVMHRHYGASAPQHVEGINVPKQPPKPPGPIDIIADRSLWQPATLQDGSEVIRIATGNMREGQIASLEKELVKNGFRPVRHESSTLGSTLRIDGGDAARLTQWQGQLEQWKQQQLPQAVTPNEPAKPGKISAFLGKIMGHRIIEVNGEPPRKQTTTKPGLPQR